MARAESSDALTNRISVADESQALVPPRRVSSVRTELVCSAMRRFSRPCCSSNQRDLLILR
jgi:hypothetical protein